MDSPAPRSDRRARPNNSRNDRTDRANRAESGSRSRRRSDRIDRTGRPARNRNARGNERSNRRPDSDRQQSNSYERELDAALDKAAAQPTEELGGFDQLELPPKLVESLARQGIRAPFAIQARTLPDALAGRDILGRAQTGSGKTLAFGIPLLARLESDGSAAERRRGAPRGLVLVPTRELAQQVTDALGPLARRLGLRIVSVYGGAPMHKQITGLRSGVDIVVATPGRLIDLMEQGECVLSEVGIAVLDEADYMADLGFLPAVTRILDDTPSSGQRMLFSATLDRGVSGLVRRYLREPAFHAVAPAAAPVESVLHRTFVVKNEDKVALASEIAGRPGRTLFFVRTKYGADRLARQLGRSGVQAVAIHGNLRQGARNRALSSFSTGETRVLVATDVAARGIHVDDLDLVIHFDPAADAKDYLHRSGRTARAGATGTVVSFTLPDQRKTFTRLLEDASVSAETLTVEPGHEAVRELATSGTPVVVTKPRVERRDDAAKKGRSNRQRGGKPRYGKPSSSGTFRPNGKDRQQPQRRRAA